MPADRAAVAARQDRLRAQAARAVAVAAGLAERVTLARQETEGLLAAMDRLLDKLRLWCARREATQQGRPPAWPIAWFAVEGLLGGQEVRAVWDHGTLACDGPLLGRARLLVDLGETFVSDQPTRRYAASLDAPPIAVMLTLVRACDLVTMVAVDRPGEAS